MLGMVKDKRYYFTNVIKLLRNLPRLILKMNHTILDNPNFSIASHFPNCVSKFSARKALFINDTYFTYNELWEIVLSVYNKIPVHKTFQSIGVYCNDDAITYASSIAIGLYGAAYVPLNNKFPVARNKNIVRQCELELILSSVANENLEEMKGAAEIVITADNKKNNKVVRPDFQKVNQPYSCILFTSGTTGEPKGVPLTHSNINYFFDFQLRNYDFNKEDKFLQVYELTFDVSIFSFLMPLLVGGCCYPVPDKGVKFTTIIQMLKQHRITVVSMVPTILSYIKNYIAEIHLPDLRYSIFSGDALYHHLAVQWAKAMPNGIIENFYGPTETTIVCLHYPFDELKSAKESVNGIVPLGKPFDGVETMIVDEENNIAEKGELCFTGTQIISHYLHNINGQKFIEKDNKRWYKTGDVVLRNSNGNLCFLGRSDSQVKINGFRIELSEIEFAIDSLVNKKTIVLNRRDGNNINSLLAFIETKELNESKLKEQLSALLPNYMIPQEIIPVEKFPLNINEKVDRNELLLFSKKQV